MVDPALSVASLWQFGSRAGLWRGRDVSGLRDVFARSRLERLLPPGDPGPAGVSDIGDVGQPVCVNPALPLAFGAEPGRHRREERHQKALGGAVKPRVVSVSHDDNGRLRRQVPDHHKRPGGRFRVDARRHCSARRGDGLDRILVDRPSARSRRDSAGSDPLRH